MGKTQKVGLSPPDPSRSSPSASCSDPLSLALLYLVVLFQLVLSVDQVRFSRFSEVEKKGCLCLLLSWRLSGELEMGNMIEMNSVERSLALRWMGSG